MQDKEPELDCNTGSIPSMTFEEAVQHYCANNPEVIISIMKNLGKEINEPKICPHCGGAIRIKNLNKGSYFP